MATSVLSGKPICGSLCGLIDLAGGMSEQPLPSPAETSIGRAGLTPWLVILLAATAWAGCFLFPPSWRALGVAEGNFVFLDLTGVLASGEAAQLGLNPYLPNPLDVYHRPHVYTEWWLVTGRLGLTRQDVRWLGPVLIGLMLLSAVAVVRPVGRRQGLLMLAVFVSPAVLMAVNRGNNDLVAFILMSGAFGLLRSARSPPRLLGIALLALAAVLKYYPLAAAVVLLDARSRREWLGWILLFGVVLVVAWPGLVPGLQSAAKYRPSPDWVHAFGAPVIFRDFALTPPPSWLLMGGALAVAGWAARGGWCEVTASEESLNAEREFAGAAAVVVGCFALGSSYAYKLIFALWLLPWLWRTTLDKRSERWRRVTLGLLLAVLWLDGLLSLAVNTVIPPGHPTFALRLMQTGLIVSQLLSWAFVICLLRGLVIYAVPRMARLCGRRLGRRGVA
ncbi:MAG: glycosyltransferase 87 family protein [Opitutaceae bacterium]